MASERDDAAEETVVVDREAEAETVVVERVGSTVVVDRGTPPSSEVAEITRERPANPGQAIPRGRRRRGMTMPPVAPGFGRGAVDAVGPGAVSTYRPREITAPPAEPVPFEPGEATRTPAPSMPSVARRSRRTAAVTLALVAVAIVVSVVGLVLLARAVFGG